MLSFLRVVTPHLLKTSIHTHFQGWLLFFCRL
jgi:hypothetical protein